MLASRPLSIVSNTAAARVFDTISRDLDRGDDDEPNKPLQVTIIPRLLATI
jgi:hypothetical protein